MKMAKLARLLEQWMSKSCRRDEHYAHLDDVAGDVAKRPRHAPLRYPRLW
jgi:hypothetical protein